MDWDNDQGNAGDDDLISMSPRWQPPRLSRPLVLAGAVVVALAVAAGIGYGVARAGGERAGYVTGPGAAVGGQRAAVPAASPSYVMIKMADGAKVYVPGRGFRFVRGQHVTAPRPSGRTTATRS